MGANSLRLSVAAVALHIFEKRCRVVAVGQAGDSVVWKELNTIVFCFIGTLKYLQ